MLLSYLAVIVGLSLLIWSADRFVDGASGLARIMGISPLLVGILIVGFGTSAPEMLVASVAAIDGNPEIGIGNAIGSNITNIVLVLGVTAMITQLPVASRIVKIELPIVFAAGVIAYLLLKDGHLSRWDGVILMSLLFISMGTLAYLSLHFYRQPPPSSGEPLVSDAYDAMPAELPTPKAIFWTIAGLLILVASSKMLVWGAVNIAEHFGVSDLVIGLTIIAIGTSLPELAASIASARKNEIDLAVGNVVGSNLFNTLGVLALPGLIAPVVVPQEALTRDFPVMLAVSALLVLFSIGCWKSQRYLISYWKGFVLFGIFIAYEILLYLQTTQLI